MTKKRYIQRMEKHDQSFAKLWNKIVDDTNAFIADNPDVGMYSLQNSKVETLSDYLCLSGAWIQDRINGKTGARYGKKYNQSLTKKVRKALGYTQ